MTFTLGARGLSSSIKSVGCFYAPKAYPPLLGRVPGGAFVVTTACILLESGA